MLSGGAADIGLHMSAFAGEAILCGAPALPLRHQLSIRYMTPEQNRHYTGLPGALAWIKRHLSPR